MHVKGIVLVSALALAASAQLAAAQAPAPQAPATSVTIYKVPQRSYLTQGPVATPRTSEDYAASPIYQSSMPGEGIAGFSDYPLPRGFDLPGFGYRE